MAKALKQLRKVLENGSYTMLQDGYKIIFEKGRTAKAFLVAGRIKSEQFTRLVEAMKQLNFVFFHVDSKTGAIIFRKVGKGKKEGED